MKNVKVGIPFLGDSGFYQVKLPKKFFGMTTVGPHKVLNLKTRFIRFALMRVEAIGLVAQLSNPNVVEF